MVLAENKLSLHDIHALRNGDRSTVISTGKLKKPLDEFNDNFFEVSFFLDNIAQDLRYFDFQVNWKEKGLQNWQMEHGILIKIVNNMPR